MTDTQMERNTNSGFIQKANGNVLIGGLGIGLLLANISRERVTSITIIEKYQDVIDLVLPRIKNLENGIPLHVICADIKEWLPEKSSKFDSIYFDIWDNISGDNYEEMKLLHRKFREYLNKDNPKSFIDSWTFDKCKRLHSQDKYY